MFRFNTIEAMRSFENKGFIAFLRPLVKELAFLSFLLSLMGGIFNVAYANFELTPTIGFHPKRAISISGDKIGNVTWLVGGDLQYHFVTHRYSTITTYFGVGLRYQHYFSQIRDSGWIRRQRPSESSLTDELTPAGESQLNSQESRLYESSRFTGQRVALLFNSRIFFRNPFFIGFLFTVDFWRSVRIKLEGPRVDTIDDPTSEIRGTQWLGYISQAGIELGYKFTPRLIVKTEMGLNNLTSDDVTCTGAIRCSGNNMGLLKSYLSVGVAYVFGDTSEDEMYE